MDLSGDRTPRRFPVGRGASTAPSRAAPPARVCSLSVEERRRIAEAFVAARPDGFQVAIHAGAQTTADTIALAAHAQETGADAVAVIAPPYFPLDAEELAVTS